MEYLTFGDSVTQFLESNGMKRGGMAGGKYNGKVLRKLMSPEMLDKLGQHLGDEAKIYTDYLHTLREFYSILVDKTLYLELAYEKERKYRECFQVLHEACGLSETLKQHVLMHHCVEYLELTGHTFKHYSDEIVETTHGKLRYFEKKHNYNWKSFVGKYKSSRSKGSFDLWNAKHAKINVNPKDIGKKLRNRKRLRYFEGERQQSVNPAVSEVPEAVVSDNDTINYPSYSVPDVIVPPPVIPSQVSAQSLIIPNSPRTTIVNRGRARGSLTARGRGQVVIGRDRPVLARGRYYNLAPAQQQPGGQPRLQPQIRQWPTVRQPIQSGPVVVKSGPPRVQQPQKQIQVPQIISGQPGMPQQARPTFIRGQHPGGQIGRNYIIRSAGVFSSRTPAAVLQQPLTLPRPPPAHILSRLQSLRPIRPIMTRPLNHAVKKSATETFNASELLKEFDYLQSNDIYIQTQVTDTFDKSEFLRQFDSLQSQNVDILAQALVLSSIPSDSNNNDILIQAMNLSGINAEINMDF